MFFPQSQNWIIEAMTIEEFKDNLDGIDIPMDSSVLVFTGDKSEQLEIFDVYRPKPESAIRF